jgi:NADPH-ferrihemoprotein reductase
MHRIIHVSVIKGSNGSIQAADIVIFWGSESGTAEQFANRLANELEQRFGLKVMVADLSAYDHDHLAQFDNGKVAGFILSTYGDGDPPDNTNTFWRTLAKSVEEDQKLDSFHYFIFGLGNSLYRHYNRVAEVVDTSLQKLNAHRVGQFGKGDESSAGTEEDFLTWKQEIADTLQRDRKLEEVPQLYRPSIDVSELLDASETAETSLGEPHPSLIQQSSMASHLEPTIPCIMPVSQVKELFVSKNRTYLHFELSLVHVPWVKYQTGDHLAIWPMNPDIEVDRLLDLLGLKEKLASKVLIKQRDESSSRATSALPTSTTIEALFRYYLEICSPLSRDLISGLIAFAPGTNEREKLCELATDRQKFETEILASHRTLSGLLRQISGETIWQIPLSFLIERLRKTQPRRYSIASSVITQPRQASLTVVVDTTDLSRNSYGHTCYGLTTNYLLALQQSIKCQDPSNSATTTLSYSLKGPRDLLEGAKVFGQIRPSNFKLPPKESTSVILIGAGTGIAPLRGFVQERARLTKLGRSIGNTMLFMGFRRLEEDFLYREEWGVYQKALGGEKLKMFTAFSREKVNCRDYVQDRVRENAAEIFQVLEEDDRSCIYICGSARMAGDVLSELKRCLTQNDPSMEGEDWLRFLKASARLHEDIWG